MSRTIGNGAALREARSALGLSQSQIAGVWHCPSTTISRWERKPRIEFGAVSGIIYRAIIHLSKKPDAVSIGMFIRKYNARSAQLEGDSSALPYVLNRYFNDRGAL